MELSVADFVAPPRLDGIVREWTQTPQILGNATTYKPVQMQQYSQIQDYESAALTN